MFTLNLKQNLFSGLATVLDNMSPNKVQTMKQLDLVRKSTDKFAEASKPLAAKQKEIEEVVKEFNEKLKGVESKEEKEAIKAEAEVAVKPSIEERDALADEVVSVELSDDQAVFLRSNLKSLILDNLRTVKSALEVADAFEIDFDEEEKK